MKKFFGVVSGEGLGLINTTKNLIGNGPIDVVPFGHAPIKAYANIASGNLIVQTPPVSIAELSGPLEFYWTHNSLAADAQKWHFNWNKALLRPNASSTTIQKIEADGHITTYTQDSARGMVYFSNNVGEGTPFIYYDSNTQRWCHSDPKTHITEYYNTNGQLVSSQDLAGHITKFNYDAQGRLSEIDAPSRASYTLTYNADNSIVLAQVWGNITTPLRIYSFDSLGRMTGETYPHSGYSLTYNYLNQTSQLIGMTEGDNTTIRFIYDNATPERIKTLNYGGGTAGTFDYSQFPAVALNDSNYDQTVYTLNGENLISQVQMQTGYSAYSPNNQFDTISYGYQQSANSTSNWLLLKVVQPDQSVITYQYDPFFSLKTLETGPENQQKGWFYLQGTFLPVLMTQVIFAEPNSKTGAAITRYVYDNLYTDEGNTLLRYEVDPVGSVTEYRYGTAWQTLTSKRQYTGTLFDLTFFSNPSSSPLFQDMEAWRTGGTVDPAAINLTDYIYDNFGLLTQKCKYSQIDANGNGVITNDMQQIQSWWDIYGDCLQTIENQDADTTAMTQYRFDDLRNETLKIDALGRNWQSAYQYSAQQLTLTQPNGREDVISWDTAGFTSQDLALASASTNAESRLSLHRRDGNGNEVILIPPTLLSGEANIPREHKFYDRQDRVGFKVSRTGEVQQINYDPEHRVIFTTDYANPINIQKMYWSWPPEPTDTPYAKLLINQLQPSPLDRVNLKVLTPTGQVLYEADAEGYLIEYAYDSFDRRTDTIRYAAPLTQDEWQLLYAGQSVGRTANPDSDRVTRTFYTLNSLVEATQDEAGFITQNIYTPANQIAHQIIYATPVAIDLTVTDFDTIVPAPTNNDAHTYFWYNPSGLEIARLDAESYLTTKSWYANGKLQEKTRYANPVVFTSYNTVPVPTPDAEDQTETYTYDLLKRPITINKPMNAVENFIYDINDCITTHALSDGNTPAGLSPDEQRSTMTVFDSWRQPINAANAYIAQKLVEIANDPNLDPAQKQSEIAALWANNSTRTTYDPTGLKLSSLDPLGYETIYFYDNELRPIYSVGATGTLTGISYDAFNQTLAKRAFATLIPADKLGALTGGIIDADTQAYFTSLEVDSLDAVETCQYDRRGLNTEAVDAENYPSMYSYNAFRQKAEENLPLSRDPSTGNITYYTLTHEYDTRGYESQTIETSSDQSITVTTTSDHIQSMYGSETQSVDARGCARTAVYDRLNRPVEKTETTEGSETAITHIAPDAFGRTLTLTDALGAATAYVYSQSNRSVTVNPPVNGTAYTETYNIFNQKVLFVDANNNSEQWQHEPDGQVQSHTQSVGTTEVITTDIHDDLGQRVQHYDANQNLTTYSFDGEGNVIQKVENGLTTILTPDAFGNTVDVDDPRKIHHAQQFDRRHLLLTETLDPSLDNTPGLNLITTKTYDGARNLLSKQQGDASNNNQQLTSYSMDGIGRQTGSLLDPNNLKISNTCSLDAAGQVVAKIDPNQNITWQFYDLRGKQRFEVNPVGSLKEWVYDLEGNLRCERLYANALTAAQYASLNANTTLATIANLAAPLQNATLDTEHWHFYDANNREVLNLTSLGPDANQAGACLYSTTAKVYDGVSNKIQDIGYANAMSLVPANLSSLSTSDLQSEIVTTSADRTNYYIFDELGRMRFTIVQDIDADNNLIGYVSENRYDALGNMIAELGYANAISNPAAFAKLDASVALESITLDPTRNEEKYTVYTAFNKPAYTVQAQGQNEYAAVAYSYVENQNLTETTRFNPAFAPPVNSDGTVNYPLMIAALSALVPDPTIDAITKTVFDNANRAVQVTDPLGFTDQYGYDALGQVKTHTDRAGYVWQSGYDTAGRETSTSTPEATLTLISADATTGALSTTTQNTLITKQKQYDAASNLTMVTEGANLEATLQRQLTTLYDNAGRMSKTLQPNVLVDNPANAIPAFNQRPDAATTLTTQTIYNGKGLEVTHQDESQNWSFKVYDAANQLVYKVDALGGVTGFTLNAFGENLTRTRYATPLSLNLADFTETGISLAELQANLVASPTEDEVITYSYTNRGLVSCISKGSADNPAFYYVPKDSQNASVGLSQTQELRGFDAFGNIIIKQKLVDADKNIFASEAFWFNRSGKRLASCRADGFVLRLTREMQNNILSKMEYASRLQSLPDPFTTSLAALDALTAENLNVNDRQVTYTRDLLGRILVQTQIVLSSENGQPPFAQTDYTQQFSYEGRGLLTATTYENGSIAYNYYDARGLKIATTDGVRTSATLTGGTVTIIPLTYFGYDPGAKLALSTLFKQGTSSSDGSSLPQPIALDPSDQTTLSLNDNRSLLVIKQDAEGHLAAMSYTPVGKSARNWQNMTLWVPQSGRASGDAAFTDLVVVDEQRFVFDALNRPTLMEMARNTASGRTIFQQTYTTYDTLGHDVAEGPDNINWPVYRRFDGAGQLWLTNNENGVPMIIGHDLAGFETARMRSPSTDPAYSLASLTLGESLITAINTWDATLLEVTATERDLAGRLIAQYQPAYEAVPLPDNIPLNIWTGFGGMDRALGADPVNSQWTWPQPQERNVAPTLQVRPMGASEYTPMTISWQDGLCVVDTSTLATDVYEYEINYQLIDPTTGQVPANSPSLYTTTGTAQAITNAAGSSQNITVNPVGCGIVNLQGNISNLDHVELWANDEKVGQMNGVYQNDASVYQLDLHTYPSGNYLLKPVKTGNQQMPFTLQFPLNTKVAATSPFSEEIDCQTDLQTLEKYGALNWQVPLEWQNQSVRIFCEYQSTSGEDKFHEDTIAPGTNLGEYVDNAGNILTCNTLFAHPVASITQMTVLISVTTSDGNQNWIPLLSDLPPVPLDKDLSGASPWLRRLPAFSKPRLLTSDADKPKHIDGTIAINSFAPVVVLYITPLTGFSAPPQIQFFDTSLDREATWKFMQASYFTVDGIVMNVTGFAPGDYPFQIVPPTPKTTMQDYLLNDTPTYAFQVRLGGNVYPSNAEGATAFDNGLVRLKGKTSEIKHVELWQGGELLEYLPGVAKRAESNYVIDMNGYNRGQYHLRPVYQNGRAGAAFAVSFNQTQQHRLTDNLVRPGTSYARDVWNNISAETDALGNTTQATYNYRNKQLCQIKPAVTIMNPDGSTTQATPTEYWTYNAIGAETGYTDANGNLTTYTVDEAGQQTRVTAADGTPTLTQIWDALGEVTDYADALAFAAGKWWHRDYDHLQHIISLTSAEGKIQTYTWSENGQQSSQTNPALHTWRQNFDPMGNTIASYLPLGEQTLTTYDNNRQPLTVVNADNSSMSWSRDYWGRPETHNDLGGAAITYTYDQKGQLLSQQSTGGNRGAYTISQIEVVSTKFGFFYAQKTILAINAVPMPNQNLAMTYVAGQLVQVQDLATGQTSTYEYDLLRRRVGLQINRTQQGQTQLLRDATSEYNAAGWQVLNYDSGFTLQTFYDANANRLALLGNLYSSPNSAPNGQASYNKVDSANRIIVENGVLQNGAVVISGVQGLALEYVNDVRNSETTYVNGLEVTTTHHYDNDGVEMSATRSDGLSNNRYYDPAGWQKEYVENDEFADVDQQTSCDENGWVQSDGQTLNGNTQNTAYSNFMADGQPQTQQTVNSGQGGNVTDNLNMGYVEYDSHELSSESGTRTDQYGTSAISVATRYYDPNGGVSSQTDLVDNADNNNTPQSTAFITAYDGTVISQMTSAFLVTRYFYTPDNQYLASYQEQYNNTGFGGMNLNFFKNDLDRMSGNSFVRGLPGNFMSTGGTLNIGEPVSATSWVNTGSGFSGEMANYQQMAASSGGGWLKHLFVNSLLSMYSKIQTQSAAQSSAMSAALSSISNPELPTFYCVKEGDSFTSIALMECRDADYAAGIAAANGYSSPDDTPTTGQVLTIPNLVPSEDNLLTGLSYSTIYSSIMGSLYPQLQTPQPPHHHHHWWEVALVIVVSIVVAVVATPVAGAAVAAIGMSGVGATIAAAAIAGAVADFAAQNVADLEGLQSGISWSEVLSSALEAAVMAKAPGVGAMASEGVDAEEIMEAVLYYGAIAVADQLILIATGQQNGFDLKGLMASMVAAAATSAADTKIARAGIATEKSFNQAIDMLSSHIFDNMPLDMADFAGKVLGTAAGTELTEAGDYLKSVAQSKAAASSKPASTPANSASQTTDRYAAPDSEAKRTSTSQYSGVQNAQNSQNLSFMSDLAAEVDADFAQAISISSSSTALNAAAPALTQTQRMARQQAQAGVRASTTPFASNIMGRNFNQDLAANFKTQMGDLGNWADATADNISQSNFGKTLINEMPNARTQYMRSWSDVKLSYARMSAYGDSTNFFGQRVYTDAFSSDLNNMFTNGLKYGGGLLVSNMGTLFKVFDVASATEDAYNAPAGQAGWVALKEYGAIPFAGLGGGLGGLLGLPIATVVAGGVSLVADPVAGVVAGAATDITASVVGASFVSAGWMAGIDRIQQNVGSMEADVEESWRKWP